eukprot:516492-Rhodomonas_salina.1
MVMSMLVIVMVTGDDDKGVCTGRESFIGSLFPRRSPIGINPYLAEPEAEESQTEDGQAQRADKHKSSVDGLTQNKQLRTSYAMSTISKVSLDSTLHSSMHNASAF